MCLRGNERTPRGVAWTTPRASSFGPRPTPRLEGPTSMSNDLNFADAPFPSRMTPGFTPAPSVPADQAQIAAQQVEAERAHHHGQHHHGHHGHDGGNHGGHHGGGH